MDRSEAGEGVLGARLWLRTVGLLFSVGLVAFDSLGVTTALPRVAAELGGTATYGWALSTLTLTIVVGTLLGGPVADRRGPLGPALAGFAVFAAGLVVSGLAGTWAVFLAGRAVQGLGVGAITTAATLTAARGYPPRLRARAFAVISSAWTVPALAGPAVSGLLADTVGWRAVIAALLALCVPAVVITAAGGRDLAGPGAPPPGGNGSGDGSGEDSGEDSGADTGGLRGTGVVAGVALRGLLCAAYFTVDAFLPLGIVALDGGTAFEAGLGVSAGSLGWAAGAALQARGESRHGPRRRRRHLAVGVALVAAGTVVVGAGLLAAGVAVAAAGWALAGLGMGQAYNAGTTATFDSSRAAVHGRVTAGLQLVQTLAIAAGAGVATVLLGGRALGAGVALVLGGAVLATALALPVARRLTAPAR